MTTLAPPMCPRLVAILGVCLIPSQIAAAAPVAPEPPSVPVAPAQAASEAPGAVPAMLPSVGETTTARLTIASDSACPSGVAVSDALAALSPPAQWPTGSVRIQALSDTLVVELIADGSTRRELRVPADCGMRAATVALVIATWTGELSSDAAEAPTLRGRDAVAESKPVAPVPAPAPAARPALVDAAVPATTERELGAGLLLAVSGGVAPGVSVGFVQTHAPGGFGWQADLTLPARREIVAAGVSTRWTRAAISVAGNGRITLRRFAISVHAGLTGAYALTSGQGYAIDQGAQALTMGLVAGGRLALTWRRVRIWTDVRICRWLFPQEVAVDNAAGGRVATLTLPSTEFQWSAGLAYLFR